MHSEKKKGNKGKIAGLIGLLGISYTIPFISTLLFITGTGIMILLFNTPQQDEREQVLDLSNCTCGDCSQGYEFIGNTTTGGTTSGSGSGLQAAHGKKITDATLNPYDLPLYDGLTMDATKLGCDSWEINFDTQNDITSGLSTTYGMAHDNRVKVGASYGDNNYGPDATCGTKVPYTDVDGRMSLAIPWRYTYKNGVTDSEPDASEWTSGKLAGRYFDVVFKDGTVLAGIMGDAKGKEANSYDSWAHTDKSVLEVVQYTDLPLKQYNNDTEAYAFAAKMTKDAGLNTVKYNGVELGPEWKSILGNRAIAKIVVYDKNYYTSAQGYKKWFTDSLTGTPSSGNSGNGNGNSGNNNTGGNGATGNTALVNGVLDVSKLNTQESDLVGADNQEKIWNYFKSLGFTDYSIAGIFGSMHGESKFNTNAKQRSDSDDVNGSGGYGLIQWTGASRKGPLFAYLDSRGLPKDSLCGQLDYIVIENMDKNVWLCDNKATDLQTSESILKYGTNQFESIERAVYEFLLLTERPGWTKGGTTLELMKQVTRNGAGGNNYDERISLAEQYYSKYSGKTVPPVTGGGSTTPVGGNSSSGVKTSVKLNYSADNVDVTNWDGKVTSEYDITCKPLTINVHILPDKNSNPHVKNIEAFITHYWAAGYGEHGGDVLYSGWSADGVATSSTFTIGSAGDVWQYVPLNRAPNTSNTNNGTLSVEVADSLANGQYSAEAYESLVHLAAWACYTYNLDTDFNWQDNPKGNKYWDFSPLRRHYDTLASGKFRGKACPAYWTPNDGSAEQTTATAGGNLRWIAFKEDVTNFIVKYRSSPDFNPTNMADLAGYQESLALIDKTKTPNWSTGVVNGGSSDLADYRGKGCGCKIPCDKCTCHDADAEAILNGTQVGGTTTGKPDNGQLSDTDGIPITGGVPLSNGGEGKYWKIDNNILSFTGATWQSTTFMKNSRAVLQQYVASGYGYIYGGYKTIPSLGSVRMDCSGYLTQVLKLSGYPSASMTSGTDLTALLGFERVAYADMQPGDIVSYSGHTNIFAGWKEGSEGSIPYYAYSWGGQADKTAYGSYAEPRLYNRDMGGFKAAYRPVPPAQ